MSTTGGSSSGGSGDTSGGSTTNFPNPLTIIFDQVTTEAIADYASSSFAKALFDEYFKRLNQINAAQIALQTALDANSKVLSLQSQIQALQDNNTLIATVANTNTTGMTPTEIQTQRNNIQIGLLQARLTQAQSKATIS